jgi:hypothetical protein
MQRPGNALADFTVNPRVFFISALAFVVGLFASFIAVALIWLINLVTNVAFLVASRQKPPRQPTAI